MNENRSASSGCLPALVGALIANVVVVAAVFGLAAIFGFSEPPLSMHAKWGPTEHGVRGGLQALFFCLIASLLAWGIPQLVAGAVGALIALVIKKRGSRRTDPEIQ